MKIQESQENYLEAIYMLSIQRGDVRSIDIVRHLGFSKPSVSVAMKQLKDNGYIHMDEKGYITLLDQGKEIAQRIYERHQTIAQMLISLGVSEDIAFQDACKIEHDISEESFSCIKAHFLAHQ